MLARTSAFLVMLLCAGQAQAIPLTSTDMLQQFNVVVSGNVNSTSHVDGRTYVGGNVNGGAYVQHAHKAAASNYAGLTVGGSVSNVHVNGLGAVVRGSAANTNVNSGETHVGGTASNSSFNGNVWIDGAASNVNFGNNIHAASYSGINVNGKVLNAASSAMTGAVETSISTDFASLMTGLSMQLSALQATPGTSVNFSNNNQRVTFNGTAVDGMLVFDLTTLDSRIFSSVTTDLSFNLNGASTVIFNTNDSILNLTANFANAQHLGSSMIWNFAGADSVTVGRTFGGQVLVADGMFSNTGGANVEGGVFAKNLKQGGEIHAQAFTGSIPAEVPEPGTLALLMAGAGIIGFTRRRRRSSIG